MSSDRAITTELLEWFGIKIEIRYEREWLGGDLTAHLEIRSIGPESAPLPITNTGYRSHFTHRENIDEVGGPVEFVSRWLDQEADTKRWRDVERKARQYTLL